MAANSLAKQIAPKTAPRPPGRPKGAKNKSAPDRAPPADKVALADLDALTKHVKESVSMDSARAMKLARASSFRAVYLTVMAMESAPSWSTRLKAAALILDRAMGKPTATTIDLGKLADPELRKQAARILQASVESDDE